MNMIPLPHDLAADLQLGGFHVVTADTVEDFLDKADEISIPAWPEFMLHDPVSSQYWRRMNVEHAGFQFALVENDSKRWLAVGNSIPVNYDGAFAALPDEGWDWALANGIENNTHNMVSAIAIAVRSENQGQGLSSLMVRIMRTIAANHGYPYLIAPVRPNRKHTYPQMNMEEYVGLRQNGLPIDPWLRVHEKLGAEMIRICPRAMTIPGSIRDWQTWTGMTFPASGNYDSPGALVPVNIDLEKDRGVYVEPNVWMIHRTTEK